MTRCHTCGTAWTGHRIEHCPSCHHSFTGTTAGDMHRTGEHHLFTGSDRRRCLDAWEMEARGMVRNSKGHWMSKANTPENGRPQRPESDEQPEAGGLVQPEPETGCVQYGSEVE